MTGRGKQSIATPVALLGGTTAHHRHQNNPSVSGCAASVSRLPNFLLNMPRPDNNGDADRSQEKYIFCSTSYCTYVHIPDSAGRKPGLPLVHRFGRLNPRTRLEWSPEATRTSPQLARANHFSSFGTL